MATQVSTEPHSSAFIAQFTSYPVVSDSISAFNSNPLVAKALSFAEKCYITFAKPVLPRLRKPYQYVSPFVTNVDSFGASTLSKIDATFPLIKKPTGEIHGNVRAYAFSPVAKATEGKEYLRNTFNSEVKKFGGEGFVAKGKAAVITTLRCLLQRAELVDQSLSCKQSRDQGGGEWKD